MNINITLATIFSGSHSIAYLLYKCLRFPELTFRMIVTVQVISYGDNCSILRMIRGSGDKILAHNKF